jgi:transmembrane sensor
MSNLVAFPDSRKAREEASLWLAGLDRGLSDVERADLRGWLRDPLNNRAFLEMGKLWRGLDAVAVLSELFPLSPEVLNPTPRRSFTAIIVPAVAAACIAAVGTFMLAGDTPWSIMQKRPPLPPVFSETYRTAVGETRVAKLADGSTVTLNTRTRIVIFYSPTSRDVYLQYGEARFDVARENARPFKVYMGKREVQALGTTFNVRLLTPETAEITVTEGKVKVLYDTPRPAYSPARRRDQVIQGETIVSAQEFALIEPGLQTVRKLDDTEISMRLAWQRGMLFFQGEPLELVLDEMNRYTSARFVFADETLREARVGGYFRAGDVESLRSTLRHNFLIDSAQDAQGRIVLSPIPPPH